MKIWHLKKTKGASFSGCISKARANSKSKLTFSESSFNFFSKKGCFLYALPTWIHDRALHPYNPRYRYQWLARLKELKVLREVEGQNKRKDFWKGLHHVYLSGYLSQIFSLTLLGWQSDRFLIVTSTCFCYFLLDQVWLWNTTMKYSPRGLP